MMGLRLRTVGRRAMTLALVLVFFASGTTRAEAKVLRKLYDWTTIQTTWAMHREAHRARIRIDRDVDVLLTPELDLAFATIEGFENFELDNDADGAELGLLYLRGHRVVPNGFYILEIVASGNASPNLAVGDAYAQLIDSRGRGQYRFPLSIGSNPDPGLAPRRSFLLEGANNFSIGFNLGAQVFSVLIDGELELIPDYLPIAQVGENFITTFMTANGIPPHSFTSVDPLPPGLALNGGSLTGQPTMAGDFSFTIQASDSAGNLGTRSYTLTVLPEGLQILTDALPSGVVNASYGAQVLALGGVRPYRWRIDSGVPEGLTFGDSGFFSGRPSVAGMFIVTVTVQDQVGAEASADLMLTVSATGLVSLTPEFLPEGRVGAPYNAPVLPSGGIPPYECELVAGQLPPGLSLSGCATFAAGVPTVPGLYCFVIRITDSAKQTEALLIARYIRVVAPAP